MTENENLYYINKKNGKYTLTDFITKTTCLSKIKTNNAPYCLKLKTYIKDDNIIIEYLSDLEKGFTENIKIELITIDEFKFIYVDTSKIRYSSFKLLINQIIRYINSIDNVDVVHTYLELKHNTSIDSFWKLFTLANFVSKENNYYNYHQPFYSLNVKVRSNIYSIIKRLKTNTINNSVSNNMYKINQNVLDNLANNYHNKNYNYLEQHINDIFINEELYIKCINNKNCIHISKNKIYNILENNDSTYTITNDDFCKKTYNKKRFKLIL